MKFNCNFTKNIFIDAVIKFNQTVSVIFFSEINFSRRSFVICAFDKLLTTEVGGVCQYNNRGIVLKKTINLQAAIDDYTKAIELNPNYAEAYFNRGNVYSYRNNYLKSYSQAIADYTQAINLNPNFASAYQGRGLCYKAIGRNSEAEKDFAKATELGYNG